METLARTNRVSPEDIAQHQKPKFDLLPPDLIDKKTEFKHWLALFFIGQGRYKITDKGYDELAPKETRMDTDFAESSDTRERSRKREIIRPLMRRELVEKIAKTVEKMLTEGKAEELYNNGYIDRPTKLDWRKEEVRVIVIKKLLGILAIKPKEITGYDFYNNGLSGLLSEHYNGSPYAALFEAGLVTDKNERYIRSKKHTN